MKCKITRLLSLFMVLFTMSLPVLASNHYSKVVATAVGEGKVYASKTQTNSPVYKEGSSEASTDNGMELDAPTNTYYLYAQAKDGSEFVGWFDNAQCTGKAASTNTSYKVEFTANSTDSGTPTTKTFYAKFKKVGIPSLVYSDGHVYVNITQETYKNATLTTENVTEEITYESSNKNVATVAADGTVTVKKVGSCYIKAKSGEGEGSYVLTVIDNVAAGKTQIGNGDFENWSNVTSSNHAPNNWNSFETAVGSMAGTASEQQVDVVEEHRPGSDGLFCVDIWARSVLGIVAQGSLTTGCLNAGATQASAKENNSFSDIDDVTKSETLSKVPSAIKMWVKFVPVASGTPKALVTAAVHDAHNYVTYSKDEYENEDPDNRTYAIAKAKFEFTACDWTEVTIPLEPTGNTTDGQLYILLNIATNNTPGKGAAGDHLYIDDIELVYPDPVTFNKYIGIMVNGFQNPPLEAPIEVTQYMNNTIDFNLKNFAMDGINVGNISVSNLRMDKDGNFSYKGNIQITAGDTPGVNNWIGPGMGEIPIEMNGTIKDNYFYVHIDIDMDGQNVVVEVGDKADATVSVSEALKGTFCAPFTVAIPSNYQSVVTASTVTGQTNGVLNLEPVQNGIIPANTPVVVEALQAFNMNVSGIYVKGTETTPTVGLLTGVYEDTDAPKGSYVLQDNKKGKVGFFKVVEGNKYPKVGANHCYLIVPSSNVKAFYFNEEDATGIENVNVNDNLNEGAEAIYNVAGQRINKLQKGINIINGKKILK